MATRETVFSLVGMDCPTCALSIERSLERVPGVYEVRLNYVASKAVVRYDPVLVTKEQIISEIEKTGYGASEAEGAPAGRASEQEIAFIRRSAVLIAVGIVLSAIVVALESFVIVQYRGIILLVLATIVQFGVGYKFYRGTYYALRTRSLDVDVLITLSTTLAYFYSVYEVFVGGQTFFEASTTVITIVLIGEIIEELSRGRTSFAVQELLSLMPKSARIIVDGQERPIASDEIRPGQVVVVRPGERIPVDGKIIAGETRVDESTVTGEPVPVDKKPGDNAIGGTLNRNGTIQVLAARVGRETALGQIVRFVEEAQASKAPVQRAADRVVGYFIPSVLAVALVAFVVWYFVVGQTLLFSLTVMITILIVACPCALGIAVPTVIMVGTSRGAEYGMLFKRGESLENAGRVDTLVFDKTGTLTMGALSVSDIVTVPGFDRRKCLFYAGTAERNSEHPIARAIMHAVKDENVESPAPVRFNALPGLGVEAEIFEDGNMRKLIIGTPMLMQANNIDYSFFEGKMRNLEEQGKSIDIMALDGEAVCIFAISDKIKETSKEAVSSLKQMGIEVIMITGDDELSAKAASEGLGIDRYYANVLPNKKALVVKQLQEKGRFVAMVGDGVNDAPALVQADVGIALGSGTDVAIEAGDIVLVRADPRDAANAIRLSKKAMGKIRQNLFFSFIYNIIAIPIAAGVLFPFSGVLVLSPVIAALATLFSDTSTIANALLLRRYAPEREVEERAPPRMIAPYNRGAPAPSG